MDAVFQLGSRKGKTEWKKCSIERESKILLPDYIGFHKEIGYFFPQKLGSQLIVACRCY